MIGQSIDLVNGSSRQNFQAIKNQLEQFLELKIEDSFGLNSIDGRDRYSISKNLKDELNEIGDIKQIEKNFTSKKTSLIQKYNLVNI